ncbi:MAG: LysM peptidoglycan-binding domain-containing protein [Erysipelotrichaceae bacterium]
MKKMQIEKYIQFDDVVDEIISINLSEDFSYSEEPIGLKATGPLYIKGSYLSNEQTIDFEETLQLDVLAPNEKLNGDNFKLEIDDYESEIDDGIHLTITLNIYGIKEDKLVKPVEIPKEIEQQTLTPQTMIEQPNIEQPTDIAEIDDFEDLFEDTNSVYTSYKLVVAKQDDSYETIASRYNINIEDLRSMNHNKVITPKMLVLLPFE